ncbi:hypothetical protein BV898_15052 [Hypsibius exemplaris]|uniref:Serine-threonine/tyrosine-protein kinase catalytic domain-containing protein n=1 Tax=Hypsibius exemplaris TaxID=2072580 RepID=A0A9X6RK13_HYPEX|nr:hypothetical protein BV898_15052 [Hypsibius exemplaris]
MPYLGSKGGSSSLNEFVAWLVEGHQLERPPAAPIQIDDLLRQCWRLRTEERPTFTELREELDKLISDDVTDSYLALDEPYQKFNKLNEELLNTMIIVEEDCNKAKRLDTETVGNNFSRDFNRFFLLLHAN